MPTPEAQAAARDLLLAICSVGTEEEIGKMCAEALDRFAAQRGAEARDFGWVPEFLSDPPPPTEAALAGAELLSTLPLPEKRRLATEGEDATDQRPTTAQTGGGDAGLTIRNPAPDGTPPSMPTGQNATLTIQYGGGDAGERAREHASAVLYRVTEHLAKTGEWAEEDIDALRAGLAMLDSREADLRSSHREGAEAMRFAVEHTIAESALADEHRRVLRQRVRALPIPGKTDAG